MLQSFMTLVTGPFPARPHAALPFLQNFFPGAPQGIRIQCHKCKPYGDSPWRWKTRYVWKDLLWITHSRACGSWPQPHLVRRTLRKDLSGTILFFFTFTFLFSSKKDLRPTILFTSASCILLTLSMFHAAMSRLWGREWSMGEVEP